MKWGVRLAIGLLMASALLSGGFVIFTDYPVSAQTLTPEERARLQAEYDQLQAEIAQWQKVLDETKQKKDTLKGDVSALTAQINKATAEIKQRNVIISNLASEINERTARLGTLEERLESGHESLAKLLRDKNEREKESLVIFALSSEDLSEFFSTLDAIDAINRGLQALFAELRSVKDETVKEKEVLDARKNQELDAKYEVELKKKRIDENKKEKNQLLAITTEQEKSYQTVLAERQRKAEAIRSALFDLRDAQGISFNTALQYANFASEKTGIRASLVLAILSQESDLGKNIGSCYVTDLQTGNGIGKNTGTFFEKVMKAPRDTTPFESITSTLGLNWGSTPVSCPLGKSYTTSRGYGGAMGPSQFIPSTWNLYTSRLAAVLGISMPNPWNAKDAIMATALYLKDLGAAGGTYTAERNAACKYYSGRSCDSRSPINYTYGNSVIAKAETFQENIDFLNDL